MEINPTHPSIIGLKSSKDPDIANLVFDLAALTSGYDIDDKAAFSKRINDLLIQTAVTPIVDDDDDDEEEAKDVEVIVD